MNGGLLDWLKEKGYTVTVAGRQQTPELSASELGNYGQLWLFAGDGEPGGLPSEPEMAAISGFVDNGGSLLLIPGPYRAERDASPALNRLSGRYGVRYAGHVDNREEIQTTIASHMFSRASLILADLLKLVHKI